MIKEIPYLIILTCVITITTLPLNKYNIIWKNMLQEKINNIDNRYTWKQATTYYQLDKKASNKSWTYGKTSNNLNSSNIRKRATT